MHSCYFGPSLPGLFVENLAKSMEPVNVLASTTPWWICPRDVHEMSPGTSPGIHFSLDIDYVLKASDKVPWYVAR